jgi:hypothetical protein
MSDVSLITSFKDGFSDAVTHLMKVGPISKEYTSNPLVSALSDDIHTLFLPSINTGGFLDYSDTEGVGTVQAAITREKYTLETTRSSKTVVPEIAVMQQGNMDVMQAIAQDFMRNHAIPEIDTYRFSKWAGQAKDSGRSTEESLTINTVLDSVVDSITKIHDEGINSKLTIFMNVRLLSMLAQNSTLTGNFQWDGKGDIDVDFGVGSINGCKIIGVPSVRFYTDVELLNTGQGGFRRRATSQDINFMILGENAAWYWTLLDKVVLATPDSILGSGGNLNAYMLTTLIHHDAGLIKGLEPSVHVSLAPVAESAKAKVKTFTP